MELNDWPSGTPDERYREQRRHAEDCFQLNLGLAVGAWEASAAEAIVLNHLNHPSCPVEPSFGLRDHGAFAVALSEAVITFATMALDAYSTWLSESGVPAVEAMSKIRDEVGRLSDEALAAKWTRVLRETGLDQVNRPDGWSVDIQDLFKIEVEPAIQSSLQAAIDRILDPDDASEVLPSVEDSDAEHAQYMGALERWQLTAGPDGGKLPWPDVAMKILGRRDDKALRLVRANSPNLRNKSDKRWVYDWIDKNLLEREKALE